MQVRSGLEASSLEKANESYLRTRSFFDDNMLLSQRYAFYKQFFTSLLNKQRIECELTASILGEYDEEQLKAEKFASVPDEALQRISGSLLEWVLCQLQQRSNSRQLPGRLEEFPLVTREQAITFARAWALWPTTPYTRSLEKQERIVSWLISKPQTLGWLASTLIQISNYDLADKCIEQWKLTTFDHPRLDLWLEPVLQTDRFVDSVIQALTEALILHQGNVLLIERLGLMAFRGALRYEYEYDNRFAANALYLSALQATEIYQSAKFLTDQLSAVRIACLSHLGQHILQDKTDPEKTEGYRKAALREYSTKWYPNGNPFPYPYKLLPAFNILTDNTLHKHLLKNHLEPEWAPDWVRDWLLAEELDQQENWYQSLPIWSSLFENATTETEKRHRLLFLARWTEAYVNGKKPQGNHTQRLNALWSNVELSEKANLQELAKSARLLLLPRHSLQIVERYDRFQTHFDSHPLITLATRAYLLALVHQKQWGRLVDFVNPNNLSEQQTRSLWAICSRDEYFFFHKMAEAQAMRQRETDHQGVTEWCYLWESLISLRILQTEPIYMTLVLEQFLHNRTELRQWLPSAVGEHTHYQDVERQMERRVKAICEYWLRKNRANGQITAETFTRNSQDLKITTLGQPLLGLLRSIIF